MSRGWFFNLDSVYFCGVDGEETRKPSPDAGTDPLSFYPYVLGTRIINHNQGAVRDITSY